jgi:hypothetical protein
MATRHRRVIKVKVVATLVIMLFDEEKRERSFKIFGRRKTKK